ncbi:phage collar protein [Cernens ardua]|uniref:phage collar protein n=1 Tax=Cernens ardua TaxID=3402176 RepID=UPI003F99D501
MNLRQIANSATRQIHHNIAAQIYRSTGATVLPDGSQVPGYAPPIDIQVQMQAVSQRDLEHADAINLQGKLVSFWVNGQYHGIQRKQATGGDIIVVNGEQWLIVAVPEIWDLWTHCIGCLQVTTDLNIDEGWD